MLKSFIYDRIIAYTEMENMIKKGSVESVLLGRNLMLCYLKSSNIKYGITSLMHDQRSVFNNIRSMDSSISINPINEETIMGTISAVLTLVGGVYALKRLLD